LSRPCRRTIRQRRIFRRTGSHDRKGANGQGTANPIAPSLPIRTATPSYSSFATSNRQAANRSGA
jgi:hypothetical protein